MIKNKLSRDILGLLCVSVIISLAGYLMFRILIDLFVIAYCTNNGIELIGEAAWEADIWIRNGSMVATIILFVFLFLVLVGGRIDRAIKQIQRKEAQLREERETLIRNLSHDIRTPLTTILSYSEFMRGKECVEKRDMDEYIFVMMQKAEQIKTLTNQLLDGGQRNLEFIENGKLLMEQLADEWTTVLEGSYSCIVEMEECPEFSGTFDVQELRRIFDNLASNIEKYADFAEPVVLKCYAKDKNLMIEQSNGKKKQQEKVESRKIGIQSIRKIAEHYNGTVEITETEKHYSIKIVFFRIL